MFTIHRIFPAGSYRFDEKPTLPEACEVALFRSTIAPEDVIVVAEGKPYRIEAIYRDGVRVGFSAEVPA